MTRHPSASIPAARAASLAALVLVASACGVSCKRDTSPAPVSFGTATIQIKGKAITVEVANTDEQRNRGLMYRDALPKDSGMLFVYKQELPLAFWMKNTLIPLDIAFIKADGWICDIQQMEPGDLGSYKAAMNAKFALEMNKGWFEANGISVGDQVQIPADVAATE